MTTAVIPAHVPPVVPAAGAGAGKELFSTVIPQEFHDRPYLKDFMAMEKTPEAYSALFKKLDGAETLIGKKTGIPGADAKPEDWDQFFAKIRPETADAYEIPVKEGVTDPEFVKAMKGAFFEAGLSKSQASKMQEKFEAAVAGQQAAHIEAQKKLNLDFEVLTKATFGPDNAKALERAKGMIQEHTPENLKTHVASLPNESLVVLAGILNAVHSKYGLEDRVNGAGSGTGGDANALREEGRKLMASPEFKDAFHPRHEAVNARVKQIYADVAKIK